MKKKLLLVLFLILCAFPLNATANEISISSGNSCSFSTYSISLSQTGNVTSKQVNVLYQALKNYKPSVNLKKYNVQMTDMQVLLDKAFTKDPYVQDSISFVNVKYNYNYKGYVTTVYIDYMYSVKTMKKRLTGLKKAVETAKKEIGSNLTPEEAVLQAHDYIIKHATFNTAYANTLTNNPNFMPDYDNHSAYGILCKRSGVCSGYAYTYRILLKEYGVDSVFIESKAMNHGWNMVRLKNRWYHVDVTWDDPDSDLSWTGKGSGNLVYYRYFLLNNTEIATENHYSWTPYKRSNSTMYSNMPRMSSNEQIFYCGNWYGAEQTASGYKYVKSNMKGNTKSIVLSVSPFYRLKDRIIYQPDSHSLVSMNIDGTNVRSHGEQLITTGQIPTDTDYQIVEIDRGKKSILLSYNETVYDSSNLPVISTKSVVLSFSDYDLRTTDYATSLTLSKSTLTIRKNKFATLTATIGPDWPLLNTKVVFRVTRAGQKIIQKRRTTSFSYRFKGIKKGTATITVTVPHTNLKRTCKVIVK